MLLAAWAEEPDVADADTLLAELGGLRLATTLHDASAQVIEQVMEQRGKGESVSSYPASRPEPARSASADA